MSTIIRCPNFGSTTAPQDTEQSRTRRMPPFNVILMNDYPHSMEARHRRALQTLGINPIVLWHSCLHGPPQRPARRLTGN